MVGAEGILIEIDVTSEIIQVNHRAIVLHPVALIYPYSCAVRGLHLAKVRKSRGGYSQTEARCPSNISITVAVASMLAIFIGSKQTVLVVHSCVLVPAHVRISSNPSILVEVDLFVSNQGATCVDVAER